MKSETAYSHAQGEKRHGKVQQKRGKNSTHGYKKEDLLILLYSRIDKGKKGNRGKVTNCCYLGAAVNATTRQANAKKSCLFPDKGWPGVEGQFGGASGATHTLISPTHKKVWSFGFIQKGETDRMNTSST